MTSLNIRLLVSYRLSSNYPAVAWYCNVSINIGILEIVLLQLSKNWWCNVILTDCYSHRIFPEGLFGQVPRYFLLTNIHTVLCFSVCILVYIYNKLASITKTSLGHCEYHIWICIRVIPEQVVSNQLVSTSEWKPMRISKSNLYSVGILYVHNKSDNSSVKLHGIYRSYMMAFL